MQSLPESFGGLVNLVELFITDNQLTALPDSESATTAMWACMQAPASLPL